MSSTSRNAQDRLYAIPFLQNVHDPGVLKQWTAWEYYYSTYQDDLLLWAQEIISQWTKTYNAGAPLFIAGSEVCAIVGGFSALRVVFEDTQKRILRPWTEAAYLQFWTFASIFEDMRRNLNDNIEKDYHLEPRTYLKMVGFIILARAVLTDGEPVS